MKENIINNRVCRACLKSDGIFRPFFKNDQSWNDTGLSLEKMWVFSTQIKVKEGDGSPRQMCVPCTNQLISAYTFKTMCEKSDITIQEQLKEHLQASNSNQSQSVNIKEEDCFITVIEEMDSDEVSVKSEKDNSDQNVLCDKNRPHTCKGKRDKYVQTILGDILTLHNCPECQKKFSTISGLTSHMKIHKRDTLLQKLHGDILVSTNRNSDICNLNEKQPTLLSISKNNETFEIENINTIFPKLYECTCGFNFEKESTYKKHKLTCFENLLECKKCSLEFKSSKELALHFQTIHSIHEVSISIKQEPTDANPHDLPDSFEDAENENDNDFIRNDIDYYYAGSDEIDAVIQNIVKSEDTSPKVKTKSRKKKKKTSKKEAGKQSKSIIYNCSVCKGNFNNISLFRKHRRTHAARKFVCLQCSKAFCRRQHLDTHMWLHRGWKQFQCDYCSKGYATKPAIENHMITIHYEKMNRTKEVCPICCRCFASEDKFKKHMKRHAMYTCEECGKTSVSKAQHTRHLYWHKQNKNLLCSECGAYFRNSTTLNVHMRRHRGERPYKCKFCTKSFTRNGDLTVHERYHTGIRPHLCNICGKGFYRPCGLKIHLRLHTGERPYVCSHCGKGFSQRNDYKAHMRRHTGERFMCDICGEGFLHNYHLTRHKNEAHDLKVTSHIQRLKEKPSQEVSN